MKLTKQSKIFWISSNDVEMDADIAEKDENNPSIGCLYQYFSSLSNQQSLAMRNRNSIFTKHFINALRSVKQCPQGPKLLQSPGKVLDVASVIMYV